MPYIIDFLGLVNFFNMSPKGGLVLLPDGRRPRYPKVSPHYANFFVEGNKIARSHNWSPKEDETLKGIGVVRFEVEEPSKVTLSDGGSSAGERAWEESARSPGEDDLDNKKHDPLIGKLKDMNIHIVPEQAATIVQMPIHRGIIEACLVGLYTVASRLTVAKHSGELTVTAVANGSERSFTVADGTEIVLANMSELDAPAPGNDEENHFKLYSQLDVNRRDGGLKEPPPIAGTPPIPITHPLIEYIVLSPKQLPPPGCSNTGCCSSLSNQRRG